MSKVKKYKNREQFEERELQEADYCYLDRQAVEALLAGKPVVAMGDEFPILIEMTEDSDDYTTIAEINKVEEK